MSAEKTFESNHNASAEPTCYEKPILHLVKTSFSDYPGEIAAVAFFTGCSLRCGYCYNRDIVYNTETDLISVKDFIYYIAKNSKKLTAIVLSGGEALLHLKEVKLITSTAHDLGLKVKLDTNGTLPDKLIELSTYTPSTSFCMLSAPLKAKTDKDIHICRPDYIAMDIKTSEENLGNMYYDNKEVYDDYTRTRTKTKEICIETQNKIYDSLRYIQNNWKKEECEFRCCMCRYNFPNRETLANAVREVREGYKVFLDPFVLSDTCIDPSLTKVNEMTLSEVKACVSDKDFLKDENVKCDFDFRGWQE